MERVRGIGGVFFKAKDPASLSKWYHDHLGVPGEGPMAIFRWKDDDLDGDAATVWSAFPADSDYFAKTFMLNFRVKNLDRMLAQLRAAGAQVDPKVDESEFGRFGWLTDPEGNRVELWEPPAREGAPAPTPPMHGDEPVSSGHPPSPPSSPRAGKKTPARKPARKAPKKASPRKPPRKRR